MKPGLIHLVCGSTGAGKTTYSRELASSLDGIVFSIDEWMVSLFGPDAPPVPDPDWILPRVDRCEGQIWSAARQVAHLGTPVVLDLGFQRSNHRRKYNDLAKEIGTSAELHFIDVDAEERWRRIEHRNAHGGESHHMTITREMFDYIEAIWEPPQGDELLSARANMEGRQSK